MSLVTVVALRVRSSTVWQRGNWLNGSRAVKCFCYAHAVAHYVWAENARAHREKERETATVFEQFSNQEIQLETETDFKALGANWYTIYMTECRGAKRDTGLWSIWKSNDKSLNISIEYSVLRKSEGRLIGFPCGCCSVWRQKVSTEYLSVVWYKHCVLRCVWRSFLKWPLTNLNNQLAVSERVSA